MFQFVFQMLQHFPTLCVLSCLCVYFDIVVRIYEVPIMDNNRMHNFQFVQIGINSSSIRYDMSFRKEWQSNESMELFSPYLE